MSEKEELKKQLAFLTVLWVEAYSNTKRTQGERLQARENMDKTKKQYFDLIQKEKTI